MSGSGKTTLIKSLLGLCHEQRVLILDPKPAADPIWDSPASDLYQWGKPVTAIAPMFGYDGEIGGGPFQMWYRLTGGPDRADTARRFAAALGIIAAEGHTVLILDDVRETCRQLRLAESVDSVMNLGRSAYVCAILSATETSYVSGRGQGGMVWIGHTTGLNAAKAGAELLGWRGKERQDACAALSPQQWIFSEDQPGSVGPCIVTG
jgi:energy-coupling factor transporter ATP-binding protein EcfA2